MYIYIGSYVHMILYRDKIYDILTYICKKKYCAYLYENYNFSIITYIKVSINMNTKIHKYIHCENIYRNKQFLYTKIFFTCIYNMHKCTTVKIIYTCNTCISKMI